MLMRSWGVWMGILGCDREDVGVECGVSGWDVGRVRLRGCEVMGTGLGGSLVGFVCGCLCYIPLTARLGYINVTSRVGRRIWLRCSQH